MKSIRQQLSISLFLGLFIVIAFCGLLLYALIRKALTHEFDATLLAKMRALSALIMREPAGTIELEFSQEMLPAFKRNDKPDYFQLWLENGTCFARSTSMKQRDLPRQVALTPNQSALMDLVLPDGHPGRMATLLFTPAKDPDDYAKLNQGAASDQAAPRVVLGVAQHLDELNRTLRQVRLLILSMGLSLPLIMALIVWLTVHRGLYPIARLARETEGIDEQNLTHRFATEQMPQELQPIGQRLNALMERLEISFRQLQAAYLRERRFNDNVAHELRTPIAELHTLAEVALLFPHNPELGEKAHHESLAIARQMESLVTVLLSLARCEAGIEALQLSPLALDELVAECWAAHQERAQHKQLQCELHLLPALAQSQQQLLLSIIDNLLSNAIDHCPDGGLVRVEMTTETEQLQLTIENGNTQLTPEDLELIYEPFWQKDATRAGTKHHGLGLPLVRAICQQLKIDLAISLPDLGRVRATITLPAVSPTAAESLLLRNGQ